ncbi:MAG: GDSL-type esterase/lipase family protein [Terriglobales bacterium]
MKFSRVVFPVLLVVAVFALGTAAARERGDGEARYLALGDSVAFGYITQAGFEYVNPKNFIGYPEYVGDVLRLHTVNAACPGETTGGFLSLSAVDNGCNAFRAEFPLHVTYISSQLDFATTFLSSHRETRLVTIGLGANDGFLLEDACASASNPQACIDAGLPALLASVEANMQTTLADLRATGYDGAIIVVNYYSLDYSDATGTALTQLLNQALSAPAPNYGAVVADVFTAFQAVASKRSAGNTCQAGLLNVNPQNQLLCDVHPTQTGQRLMAQTILRAYAASRSKDDDH